VKLIEENLKGWTLPDNRPETLAQRQQRATAIKNANYPGRPLDQL
jgi:ferrochelatase